MRTLLKLRGNRFDNLNLASEVDKDKKDSADISRARRDRRR